MLSKAKGQVLRVSAALNVFLGDAVSDDECITVSEVSKTIHPKTILAARNFVDVCCQHVAYILEGEILTTKSIIFQQVCFMYM